MERPSVDKVIERLEKLDIHEWSILGHYGINHVYHLTAKDNGIVINVRLYSRVGLRDDINYCISIQEENQKISLDYSDHSKKGKIYKFYEKLCKNLDELHQEEFKKRIQDFTHESEPEKTDIEKIIRKLEDTDPKQWDTNLKIDEKKYTPKRPNLTINLCGLNFSLKKELLGHCELKIRDAEGYIEAVYPPKCNNQHILDAERHTQCELIKHLYEKIHNEIMDTGKEFEEKLNAFLSE